MRATWKLLPLPLVFAIIFRKIEKIDLFFHRFGQFWFLMGVWQNKIIILQVYMIWLLNWGIGLYLAMNLNKWIPSLGLETILVFTPVNINHTLKFKKLISFFN